MTEDKKGRGNGPAGEAADFTAEELALTPFDAAEFLDSEESISAYLVALLEEGDLKAFVTGLRDVARTRHAAGSA